MTKRCDQCHLAWTVVNWTRSWRTQSEESSLTVRLSVECMLKRLLRKKLSFSPHSASSTSFSSSLSKRMFELSLIDLLQSAHTLWFADSARNAASSSDWSTVAFLKWFRFLQFLSVQETSFICYKCSRLVQRRHEEFPSAFHQRHSSIISHGWGNVQEHNEASRSTREPGRLLR